MKTLTDTERLDIDRFHYFRIGDWQQRVHGTTLFKFPGSLFYDLAKSNPHNSPDDRIIIDRDPKHLKTVMDLMRHQNLVYARHLHRKWEIAKLLKELKFYRLSELIALVRAGMKSHDEVTVSGAISVVIVDYTEYIQAISRPLVIVGGDTIFTLDSSIPPATLTADYFKGIDSAGVNWLSPYTFNHLFDHRYYDVRTLPSRYPGTPFHTKTHTKDGSYSRAIHLCLYLPGQAVPKLVLDEIFSDSPEASAGHVAFRRYLYRFLLAVDIVLNREPDDHSDLLSGLGGIKFNK